MNALVQNESLGDIADAIREKLGTSDSMKVSEMPGNIRNISGGGKGTYQQKTVHPSTSSQIVNPDTGYDALSSVTVEAINLQAKTATPGTTRQTITADSGRDGLSQVEVSAVSLQTKSVTPSTSAQTINPDSGYIGLSSVEVAAAEDKSPNLKTKNISTNGTYSASSDNADGYSQVTVDVPNTYSSSDNGKVVRNGALVPQTNVTKTENGTYDTTTNKQVTVNVTPNLKEKTITANGIYDAIYDDSADGYSSVTVNVPGGSGSATMDLLWTNSSPQSAFAGKYVGGSAWSAYHGLIVQWKAEKSLDTPNPLKAELGGVEWSPMENMVTYIPYTGSVSMPAGYYDKALYARALFYGKDGRIYFGSATRYAPDGTMKNSNDYAIPVRIYGVKETIQS